MIYAGFMLGLGPVLAYVAICVALAIIGTVLEFFE